MRRKCHIPAEGLASALLFLTVGEYSPERRARLREAAARGDLFVLTVGEVELRFTAAQVGRVLGVPQDGGSLIPEALLR